MRRAKRHFKLPEGIGGLLAFLGVALLGLAAARFTPLRDYLTVEGVRDLSARLGWWGPFVLAVAGTVGPLFLLPRWPVCFAGGMLYGVIWGAVLGNVAGLLGCWVHYLSARKLVSAGSRRVLNRFDFDPDTLSPGKAFWALFLLRAFPLSNSAATNILAGALRISTRTYLIASFLGMIPSSLMYASWGKLMKKPDPVFYALAVGILVVMVAGTALARHLLFRRTVARNEIVDPTEESD